MLLLRQLYHDNCLSLSSYLFLHRSVISSEGVSSYCNLQWGVNDSKTMLPNAPFSQSGSIVFIFFMIQRYIDTATTPLSRSFPYNTEYRKAVAWVFILVEILDTRGRGLRIL